MITCDDVQSGVRCCTHCHEDAADEYYGDSEMCMLYDDGELIAFAHVCCAKVTEARALRAVQLEMAKHGTSGI